MENMKNDIDNSNFEVIHFEVINENIVNSLYADDARRRELVMRLAPRLLRKTILNWAGTIGSETYYRYNNGKYIYFIYILRK